MLIYCKCIDLFLNSLFSFTDLCVCFLCNIILFLLLQVLYRGLITRNIHLFYSSFSKLSWLFSLLCFHINFKIICFSSKKNSLGIFMGIALNLYIALCSVVTSTIVILLIYEHGTSFHLIVPS